MKTKETIAAPIDQQEPMVPYCKRKRLNHLSLRDYFVKEDMVDTEKVARLLHLYWDKCDQTIRWGVMYNAAMDSGVFVIMGADAFKDMMNNLIAGLSANRTSVARGIKEYDDYCRAQRKGEMIPLEIERFFRAKLTLEAALKELIH